MKIGAATHIRKLRSQPHDARDIIKKIVERTLSTICTTFPQQTDEIGQNFDDLSISCRKSFCCMMWEQLQIVKPWATTARVSEVATAQFGWTCSKRISVACGTRNQYLRHESCFGWHSTNTCLSWRFSPFTNREDHCTTCPPTHQHELSVLIAAVFQQTFLTSFSRRKLCPTCVSSVAISVRTDINTDVRLGATQILQRWQISWRENVAARRHMIALAVKGIKAEAVEVASVIPQERTSERVQQHAADKGVPRFREETFVEVVWTTATSSQ